MAADCPEALWDIPPLVNKKKEWLWEFPRFYGTTPYFGCFRIVVDRIAWLLTGRRFLIGADFSFRLLFGFRRLISLIY